MAVGSVAGALAAGARGRVSPRILVGAATGFGALELLAAAAPSLPLQVLALVPAGRDDRDLLGGRQLDDAARRRAGHARARDGAVLRRLPRLDPDRRAARRVAGRGRGPARRDGARRDAALAAAALASAAYARIARAPGRHGRPSRRRVATACSSTSTPTTRCTSSRPSRRTRSRRSWPSAPTRAGRRSSSTCSRGG